MTDAAALAALQDFYGDDPLHPDLVPYLEKDATLGTMLRSPLVFSVPHNPMLNRLVNRQYAAKKGAVAEALAAGEWPRFVWLHERPYRVNAMVEHGHRMPADTYWELVGATWSDTEFPSKVEPLWRRLWTDKRPGREQQVMDTDERAWLAAASDPIRVYRGVSGACRAGLAWTVDRAKAEWFARRWKGRNATVLIGSVAKQHVLAYLTGRGEREIVALPRHVIITSRGKA